MSTVEPDKMRLGKKDYKFDPRTLKMATLLAPAIPDVPNVFDLERGRKPIPRGVWGNADYGDCVKVAKFNHLASNARLDRRRTLKITDDMVIGEYKADTGCQSPGDPNDSGLVMLDNFNRWRTEEVVIPQGKYGKPFPVGIEAFGEVNKLDNAETRAACYLLGGIEFGVNLPWTAAEQIRAGQPWDDTRSSNADAQPGSWGGHAIYSCHYDEGGFYVYTWGQKQYMTNAFVARYAEEVWAVVDKIEGKYWLPQSELDNYFAKLAKQA